MNKTQKLFTQIATIMAPPPELTVSEWADNYRFLSAESSAEPGKWNTDRAPYQREIMNAVNDPETETIAVMTSSQVGKTEIINNIIGYYVAYDPAPMLLVQPTEAMAQAYSKDRLAPMIRDTPVLTDKISEVKAKDSSNTQSHKKFPGGHISLVGANAPSSLASRPIRILLADEVDRFPVSAGNEGDPLSLAAKRTKTFWNKKKIYVSTPTVKEASRIESEYQDSTQEQWCLSCPSCGYFQPLRWAQIRFEDVTMECKYCKENHTEIEWKDRPGEWIAGADHNGKRGFHLNALASPWETWGNIISDFKDAKARGKDVLKTWVNTSLGESWEDDTPDVEEEMLMKRRERYHAELPKGVLLLTAAVDVQDDRLEVEVVGWGAGKESWGITYQQFYGEQIKKPCGIS
ncbi:phage terminase, large subunit [Geomicrobium sp. JCM 19037]|nr:terminase gpA endonuclease subunit [Geomicrobium sp. JCM 19037]GAK06048.1 phage terminase, large subunit [Geomicrobium sp. JCM 19037]